MSSNLDRYLPEFDEDNARGKLAGLTTKELTDRLIYEYKLKRVIAKMFDESEKKLRRIEAIIDEPSNLTRMPGIPSSDDLGRMMGDD